VSATAESGVAIFGSAADLRAAVGTTIGSSEWLAIEQDRIDTFADATGDHQWIHVDPVRAADGPFGAPIAHGYLTLSLVPVLAAQVYRVDNVTMSVNYGLNKVRFVTPVRVGSEIRDVVELVEVVEVAGGLQLTWRHTIEIKDADRPACVAESISRQYFPTETSQS
jgi:acyl dehydratase